MILYNRERLDNLLVLEQVKKWYKKGLLNMEQVMAIISASQPAYKRSHILYRTGVFLLTTVILFSSSGIFGLLFNSFNGEDSLKIMMFLASFIIFGYLFMYVRNKHHYKTGVDDALLYNGLLLFIGAFQWTFNRFDGDFFLFMVITSLPVILIASTLFIDRFLSLVSFAAVITLVFLLTLKAGIWGKMLLPFILMAVSLVIYFLMRAWKNNRKLYLWKECFEQVGFGSLITLYLSGNYYVVREASVMLMNIEIRPGEDIPFAFLFYAFTLVVPLVYIFIGLKERLYSFLNLGLLFVALSVLTIRYYYSIMAVEVALLAGGFILLLVSWLVMRYLKTPKYQITVGQDEDVNKGFNLTAEALVIAQSFHQQPAAAEEGTQFGGGEFGGGGAGSKY
jgi:hypothetical protein